jgi:SNF2 family DNA or RNA helicase
VTTTPWPVPAGLQLKAHQHEAVRFAVNRLRSHRGVMIADVMGPGKTIQAVVTANAMGFKRVLVLCPASVLLNWEVEISKWQTLGLPVFLARSGWDVDFGLERGWWIANYDVIGKFPSIHDQVWDFLVIDESHKLKNPRAKRTQLVLGGDEHRAVTARKALLLTGTPMVNYVHDLFTQLHYIDPDTWPSLDRFICDHYEPGYIRVSADQVIGKARNLIWLRHQLRKVMIRRPKSVLQLPPKKREKVEVAIMEDEAGRVFLLFLQKTTRSIEWAQKELMDLLNDGLTEADPEVRRLRELIAEKVAVVRRRVGEYKVPFAVQYLSGLTDKTLVFAHHTEVIMRLVDALKHRGVAWFTGSSSLEQRHRAALKFQKDPDCQFFIGNIEAAGTGITLTMASRVVFVEIDFRGTSLEQAEDRAHRIGQTRPVTSTFLLLNEDSTDNWMDKKACEKQAVIDEVLNSAETPLAPQFDVA